MFSELFWRVQLFHDLKRVVANGAMPYLSTELAKSEDSINTLMALHSHRRPDEPSSCRLMDVSPARRQWLHEERMHVLGLDTGEIGMEVGYPDEFNNGWTAADFDNSRMPPELQVENWSGYPHPSKQVTLLEDELLWSALDYIKEDAHAISHPDFSLQTARDWPVPCEELDDWDYVGWQNSRTNIPPPRDESR